MADRRPCEARRLLMASAASWHHKLHSDPARRARVCAETRRVLPLAASGPTATQHR